MSDEGRARAIRVTVKCGRCGAETEIPTACGVCPRCGATVFIDGTWKDAPAPGEMFVSWTEAQAMAKRARAEGEAAGREALQAEIDAIEARQARRMARALRARGGAR